MIAKLKAWPVPTLKLLKEYAAAVRTVDTCLLENSNGKTAGRTPRLWVDERDGRLGAYPT